MGAPSTAALMSTWVLTALASEAEALLAMPRRAGVFTGFTGMGPERARRFVERLEPRPSRIVFGGVAGGLDPALATGDLVLATHVTDGKRTVDVAGVDRIASLLEKAGLSFRRGKVLEVPKILGSREEKERAAAHACVVAMEDLAVVEAARALGAEIAVLRVVLDGAGESLPDLSPGLDEAGRPRPFAFAAHLARNPKAVLALPRLARGFAQARKTLDRALEIILASL